MRYTAMNFFPASAELPVTGESSVPDFRPKESGIPKPFNHHQLLFNDISHGWLQGLA
jgi:hypothetical protein